MLVGVHYYNFFQLVKIKSEAYLEPSQKSKMKHFYKNSYQVLPVNYFLKNAPS